MKDVDVQILPLSSKNNRMIVKGSAVSTPNFAVVRRAENLIPAEEKLAADFGYSKGTVMADPAQPEIFDYVNYWRLYLKDIASQSTTSWGIESTTWSSDNSCLRDKTRVLGIVATNASAYSEGPPSFDKETSTLNYKVAAMHYEKDGVTPFNGQYSLVLRSDIAECLYGVTEDSAKSTISVTGEDGAVKAASSAFTLANGWFTFTANGFTHSAPTVKVKLTSTTKQGLAKKGTVTSRTALLKIGKLKYPSTSKWLVRVSTPKICKVFSSVELPGWLVIIVIGSKKSRPSAATTPVL
jgi:hypothetical protein